MSEEKLPRGWKYVELQEIAEKKHYAIGDGDHGQIKPKDYKSEGIPYIRVGDMDWGNLYFDKMVYISEEVHENNLKSELLPGDILIAKTGATIGKCCIVPENIKRANTTSSVGKVSIDRSLTSPNWILYNILNPDFQRMIWSFSNRTAQPGFNNRDLKIFKVFLPPLPEQQRIVAKLDIVFGHLDSLKEKLDRIPALLKNFRQQVLTQAVTGELTKEWREGRNLGEWDYVGIDRILKSVKSDLRTGPFGSSLKKSDHQTSGIPVWGIESISKNGEFTGLNKIFVTQEKAQELKSFSVKGGDIIISRSGTVGEICVLPNDVSFGLISTNLMMIIINPNVINSTFFSWLFKGSLDIREKLGELCKGSTRLFLTQSILKQLNYPLPTLSEQQEIINKVNQLFKVSDKIESQYQSLKAKIDQMPQAVLAKAFRGELVGQEVKEYVREIGELGMVAEGVVGYSKNEKSRGL